MSGRHGKTHALTKGWRWVGLGLLLVAASIGGGLGWKARPSAAGEALPPAVAASAVSTAAALPEVPLVASPAVMDAAAPLGAAPTAASAAQVDSVEFCGHGRVMRAELADMERGTPPAWAQAALAQYEAQKSAVLQRLAAGTPRQRVAAALLGGDVQVAAQMAASTSDAFVYQLALRSCRADAAMRTLPAAASAAPADLPQRALPTACAALSLDKLEQLQPDDAWPALARVNDARGRPAAVSQALYQLGQRERLAVPQRALAAVVAGVVGAEPTPGEMLLLNEATTADVLASTQQGTAPFYVANACRVRDLADANRRQLCEQVVRRLPELVTEVGDATTLHRLEEQLGLPHSGKSLTNEEGWRLRKATSQEGTRVEKAPSCANFASDGRYFVALAAEGELAYALARHGKRGSP